VALGLLDPGFLLLFAVAVYGYGVVLNGATLGLDELTFPRYRTLSDRLLLVVWMTLENIGFRQLRSYWAVRGLVKYLRGDKAWGTMTRKGFAGSSSPDPKPAGELPADR
jgi:hypothetical protein